MFFFSFCLAPFHITVANQPTPQGIPLGNKDFIFGLIALVFQNPLNIYLKALIQEVFGVQAHTEKVFGRLGLRETNGFS